MGHSGLVAVSTFQSPSTASPSDPSADEATAGAGAGQKPPDTEPEPQAGADSPPPKPAKTSVKRTRGKQGRKAEAELAADIKVEVEAGNPKDQPESAEAADQDKVPRVDIITAEERAAEKAADLAAIEAEVGPVAFELGLTAAGDREDHRRAVEAGSRAAKTAIDEGNENTARARAFQAVEDLDRLDSPHGRPAEEHDPWAGARWAPHGDMNVPADSDAYSEKASEQFRGLHPEKDNAKAKVFAEGPNVADEREKENERAEKFAEDVDETEPKRKTRRHRADPQAVEDDE